MREPSRTPRSLPAARLRRPAARVPAPVSKPFLAAFLAATLGGCLFETKVAGGAEDFPNTLASLGSGASESLSDHPEWDQFANLPSLSLQETDSLATGPKPVISAAAAGLAKAGASGLAGRPDTAFDLADTATSGVGRRYIADTGAFRIRTDTVVFRWDDAARDSVRGNELILEMRGAEDWRLTERLSAYRYENLDSAGGFDRAAFYERVPKDRPAGSLQHKLFVVEPGPDGDFDAKADNHPVLSLTARTLGQDTLEALLISDADGDGRLWGDGDSGLVVVRRVQDEPAQRPAVARVVQTMRAVHHRQIAKSYPVSYREARTDRDGRKVVFSIRGDRPDSAFGPGDTVTVSVRTEPGPDEEKRFLEKTNRFRVLLSSDPWRFDESSLVRFTLDVAWRPEAFPKAGLESSRVIFTPDEPLAPGDITLTGDIRIEAAFADGSSATAVGRLENKEIDVDLEESAGSGLRRFRIRWDAVQGTVLRQERLPD